MTPSRPAPSRAEILLVGTTMVAVSAAILFTIVIGSPTTHSGSLSSPPAPEAGPCGAAGAPTTPWRVVPPRELGARFGRSYARAYLGALLSPVRQP